MHPEKRSLLDSIAQQCPAAAIEAACLQLEAKSGVANPTARDDLLCKTWRLDWTSLDLPAVTTVQRLTFNRFKSLQERLQVHHVYQVVCQKDTIYTNVVQGALGDAQVPVAVAVHGRFDIIDARRLNITFQRATLSLCDTGDPDAWKGLVKSELTEDGILDAAVRFTGWSDTTYLDEDMRIARGKGRNTYVLAADRAAWPQEVALRWQSEAGQVERLFTAAERRV